jgi:hypothetical protein
MPPIDGGDRVVSRAGTDVKATTSPYPRLQIRVARDAPVAVIAYTERRRYHHLMAWRFSSDGVTHGSRFRGNLRLQDVAPDGRWYSYMAEGGDAEHGGQAWSAVAQVPEAQAAAFWPTISPWPISVWWLGADLVAVVGVGLELRQPRIDPAFSDRFHICDDPSLSQRLPGPPKGVSEVQLSAWRSRFTPSVPGGDWEVPAADAAAGPDGTIFATFGSVVRQFSVDAEGAMRLVLERDFAPEIQIERDGSG